MVGLVPTTHEHAAGPVFMDPRDKREDDGVFWVKLYPIRSDRWSPSGGNHRGQAQSRGAEKISMTAPVNVRPGRGTVGTALDAAAATHVVSFNMPAGRTRESLPRPDDERVQLVLKPEARVAVLRYRGSHDGDRVTAKFLELLVALRRAGLRHKGNPQFAGYDPPSMLPVLRRNEVWIELETA